MSASPRCPSGHPDTHYDPDTLGLDFDIPITRYDDVWWCETCKGVDRDPCTFSIDADGRAVPTLAVQQHEIVYS
ncbi:MAG: hypothetical protein ACLP9C_14745 [Acidimicrobiales bacterium]